ncbi:holo-ACP synthase [Pontibacterium sp.]|jgi:holo-[acyl-carrier protein] synthase|uniref:holo-ACP synthase n=1 Tax=Pontibacterium sp. TaxID=2036026 RepID=UPI0035623539
MIFGIGTDILQISRIRSSLERTPRLPERILTPSELEKFRASKHPDIFLAKRFAAKEAAVKALGTGIGRGISWQHFEISHDELGRPVMNLSGNAKDRADQHGLGTFHLSYSDEQEYVVAFVVAERA